MSVIYIRNRRTAENKCPKEGSCRRGRRYVYVSVYLCRIRGMSGRPSGESCFTECKHVKFWSCAKTSATGVIPRFDVFRTFRVENGASTCRSAVRRHASNSGIGARVIEFQMCILYLHLHPTRSQSDHFFKFHLASPQAANATSSLLKTPPPPEGKRSRIKHGT